MKLTTVILLGIFFLASCTSKSANLSSAESSKSEKFEILDLLEDSPNQVEIIHDLLSENKVTYKTNPVTEWSDGLGTDFEFSNGRIVSGTIYEGDSDSARTIFHEIDSIFASKYTLDFPAKARDWEDGISEYPCMKYINFYAMGRRSISLQLYLYSKNKDENNTEKAQVIIGFGGDRNNQ